MIKTVVTASVQFCSVQSLSHVWLFMTPWTAVCQASLSITNSQSSLRLMSIQSVMPSSHLILCRPLLLLTPIPPCQEPQWEISLMTKVMWRRPDRQRQIRPRGTPWICSSIYPKTRICLSYYFVSFTNSFDINKGLSPITFFLEKINLGL